MGKAVISNGLFPLYPLLITKNGWRLSSPLIPFKRDGDSSRLWVKNIQMWRLISGYLLCLIFIAIANHSNFMAVDQFASIPTRNTQKCRYNNRDNQSCKQEILDSVTQS